MTFIVRKVRKMKYSKFMEGFDEGIFEKLNNKKIELEKNGKKIYDLFVGTPDFKPEKNILNEISNKALNPDLIKYSLRDIEPLKERFITHYKNRFNVDLTKDEIMTVNGTQDGMCHVGMLFADPGDYCLLPNPGYVAFEACAKFARCKIEYYPLLEENDFMPRLDLIDPEILKKTKFVIISYPSNPTGGIITKERYKEIIDLAIKYDFVIINDNAYSDIVFDDFESFSFLSLPNAKKVGCEFYSLSKSYNTTGSRISFFLGDKEVVNQFKKLRSQYDFGMYYPIQYGAIEAMNVSSSIIEKQRKKYEERRNVFCDGMKEIGFDVKRSKGTMFVFVKIPNKYKDSISFSTDLLEKTGVLCTPGIAFGSLGDRYVRFALVKPKEELLNIIEIIKNSNII